MLRHIARRIERLERRWFECYDLGARSGIVPSQVLTEDARMLRFLTPTEAWKGRWGDDSSWKIQYVDLSRVEEGVIKRVERFGYIELPDRSESQYSATEIVSKN